MARPGRFRVGGLASPTEMDCNFSNARRNRRAAQGPGSTGSDPRRSIRSTGRARSSSCNARVPRRHGGWFHQGEQKFAADLKGLGACLCNELSCGNPPDIPVDGVWLNSGYFDGNRGDTHRWRGMERPRKPLWDKGCHHLSSSFFPASAPFPSWTSPVRPRSPAPHSSNKSGY
jgi:hypothetical protein